MQTLGIGVLLFFIMLGVDSYVLMKLTGKALFSLPIGTLLTFNLASYLFILFIFILIRMKKY